MIGITLFSDTYNDKIFYTKTFLETFPTWPGQKSGFSEVMMQIDNEFESTDLADHMIWWHIRLTSMSHAPTIFKSDRSVFEKCSLL